MENGPDSPPSSKIKNETKEPSINLLSLKENLKLIDTFEKFAKKYYSLNYRYYIEATELHFHFLQ